MRTTCLLLRVCCSCFLVSRASIRRSRSARKPKGWVVVVVVVTQEIAVVQRWVSTEARTLTADVAIATTATGTHPTAPTATCTTMVVAAPILRTTEQARVAATAIMLVMVAATVMIVLVVIVQEVDVTCAVAAQIVTGVARTAMVT